VKNAEGMQDEMRGGFDRKVTLKKYEDGKEERSLERGIENEEEWK
jgi:hypothetical protein